MYLLKQQSIFGCFLLIMQLYCIFIWVQPASSIPANSNFWDKCTKEKSRHAGHKEVHIDGREEGEESGEASIRTKIIEPEGDQHEKALREVSCMKNGKSTVDIAYMGFYDNHKEEDRTTKISELVHKKVMEGLRWTTSETPVPDNIKEFVTTDDFKIHLRNALRKADLDDSIVKTISYFDTTRESTKEVTIAPQSGKYFYSTKAPCSVSLKKNDGKHYDTAWFEFATSENDFIVPSWNCTPTEGYIPVKNTLENTFVFGQIKNVTDIFIDYVLDLVTYYTWEKLPPVQYQKVYAAYEEPYNCDSNKSCPNKVRFFSPIMPAFVSYRVAQLADKSQEIGYVGITGFRYIPWPFYNEMFHKHHHNTFFEVNTITNTKLAYEIVAKCGDYRLHTGQIRGRKFSKPDGTCISQLEWGEPKRGIENCDFCKAEGLDKCPHIWDTKKFMSFQD